MRRHEVWFSLLLSIFLGLVVLSFAEGSRNTKTISTAWVQSDGSTSREDSHNNERRLADLETNELDILPSTAMQYSQVPGPPPQQYWVDFINESDQIIELYYDNGRDGILQGVMQPREALHIGTYQGHQFFYRHPGNSHEKLYWTTMRYDTTKLVFRSEQQRIEEEEKLRQEKLVFQETYKNKTGLEWLAFYPRPKPILFMYPVTNVGQTFSVTSNYTHFNCYPKLSKKATKEEVIKCLAGQTPLKFEWTVLSVKPKVLMLKNFLSNFETEHIIELARPSLKRSQVGAEAFEDRSRTSSTAWVKRSFTEVMDWIFRRIAQVIQIDEFHLWDTIGAESLQVVRYQTGQYYRAHHDWRNNREQMRYLTFLMYLNDRPSNTSGGETYFPYVDLKAHPGKGSVVMFYNMLEDGNADDLTLHEALPVTEGEKWLCNCWVWDPNFS